MSHRHTGTSPAGGSALSVPAGDITAARFAGPRARRLATGVVEAIHAGDFERAGQLCAEATADRVLGMAVIWRLGAALDELTGD